MQGLLYAELRKWSGLRKMTPARELIARKLGARETLDKLTEKLKARPIDEPWQRGPMHGDLHTDNVQVRGGDAILIDFLQTGMGPVLADPAALEASVVFRVPRLCDRFDKVAWSRTVEELYQQPYLRTTPVISDVREPYAWIVDCVRQVRLHGLARELQSGQYAAVLAYRLLHASGKTDKGGPPEPGEEHRRATAFVMAERLLNMSWA